MLILEITSNLANEYVSIVDKITYDILLEIRKTHVSPDRVENIKTLLDLCDKYLLLAILTEQDVSFLTNRIKKCRSRLGINQSTWKNSKSKTHENYTQGDKHERIYTQTTRVQN